MFNIQYAIFKNHQVVPLWRDLKRRFASGIKNMGVLANETVDSGEDR